MRQIVNSLWYSGDVIGAQSGAHWLEIGVRECLLQPLTLSYLRTKIQLTKVGHVTYQNVGNFLSFLGIRSEFVSRQILRSYFVSSAERKTSSFLV